MRRCFGSCTRRSGWWWRGAKFHFQALMLMAPVYSSESCVELLQAPVFRELYSEKRVVVEERRLRVEDSPMGAFQEAFSAKAFANNYGRPVIGWPDDFARLGRREVRPQTDAAAQDRETRPFTLCRNRNWLLFRGLCLLYCISHAVVLNPHYRAGALPSADASLNQWHEQVLLCKFLMASSVCCTAALQVADFYRRHYGPSSLTICIVGDTNPSQVRVQN